MPYHDFASYIRLLQEAAVHKEVKSIRTTLYRLAKESKVVKALINAAQNGKRVTVVIELLARFDEASNISWSKKMQDVGIHVIFGVEGLKVHSKITHIGMRKGADISVISTGNFHEGNARCYTDYMLMTANRNIVRDATNGPDIIKRILKDTGINIEIIDGKEEAHIVYSNHLECMADRTGAYIYVDVGGGSTEVNFLTNGELVSSVSYNIGTVRLLTGKVRDDEWLRMENDLKKMIDSGIDHINIIGSGGNINKIYRLTTIKDKALQRMPIYSVQALYDELQPMTVDERIEKYGLKDDRADVIVPAAEIFLRVARTVHAEYIHVPVIGLADGIIDELYAQRDSRTPQKVD